MVENAPEPFLVDVLLTTYNGMTFLREQLDSISNQANVSINLIISDDGSNDGTIEFVKSYFGALNGKSAVRHVSIHDGPGLGPKENFLFLLTKSESPYISFADQDDVWLSNHLGNSINRIIEHEQVSKAPILTFSAVKEFGDRDSVFPSQDFSMSRLRIIFENPSRGCSQVMNGNLRAEILLKLSLQNHALMHDWMTLIIANSVGPVIYSPEPEVLYRVHTHNFTTRKGYGVLRMINLIPYLLGFRMWRPVKQFISLTDVKSRQEWLGLDLLSSSFTKRFSEGLRIVLSRQRLHSVRFIDFVFRIIFLVSVMRADWSKTNG
jgi:glycosyltransferase involved in cell wall biosynthesis